MDGSSREAAARAETRTLETLIRSLVGVRDASLEMGPDGSLSRLRVVPADGASAKQVRLNVISALMAGPGISLDPTRLSVGTADAATNGTQPVPDVVASPNGNGARANGRPALPSLRLASTTPLPGGRVRCRIEIEANGQVWVGVGEALDRADARVELAARVTADALRAARWPGQPIQIDGATSAEPGGRPHVIVSLGLWAGDAFTPRPGIAAVTDSWEDAAARAVLSALAP